MKFRRIIALAGAVLLLLMYLSTLIFSLMRGELASDLFRAAVFCTLLIPIFLYTYGMVYKYLKYRGEEIREEEKNNKDISAAANTADQPQNTTSGQKAKKPKSNKKAGNK